MIHTFSKKLRLGVFAGGVVLSLVATGCGSDDAEDPTALRTASNGEVFNDADVEFATSMIPHHAQALEMVDLTVGRDLSPEVQAVADAIREAQTPEVEQMTDWLVSWDQPVPATSMDHANAHGDAQTEDLDDHDMPGMMSADEMDALAAASDGEFGDLFLEMMIQHHQGAVEMARTEQTEGEYADSIALAQSIESSQEEEIATMEGLLG